MDVNSTEELYDRCPTAHRALSGFYWVKAATVRTLLLIITVVPPACLDIVPASVEKLVEQVVSTR